MTTTIDVDFEAQFEQLAIGGFGVESGFATLEIGSSTSSKGDVWNTNGLTFAQMVAKTAPSAKATGTTDGFVHKYFEQGTIQIR